VAAASHYPAAGYSPPGGPPPLILFTLHTESGLSKSIIDLLIGKRRKSGPFSGINQRGTIGFMTFTRCHAIQFPLIAKSQMYCAFFPVQP
jgi:hypothetical protein